ncbi:metalloregulator ArsR/SmtB family transcription factor [Thermosyntropha sp.]|uniref:ArsR/SmtB family transcription factor n=1 Tax=Thermosyntropha sp. TaxID=2740820 RepID=UPI0025DBC7B3|nr:metalloregulator ArsR/SmtB family transcription factor [Thermosyntropha sp.]MBO8159913.1 winged helix-turn-helix transcriptional regulator [Thermosyntropha sp.]
MKKEENRIQEEFDNELCEAHFIHEDKVMEVKKIMLTEDKSQALAQIFKTLGDSTRVKIIFALMNHELCVCDLAEITGSSESAVSHHLRLLRTQKLVKYRREGKNLFYSLDDHHVEKLFKEGLEHVYE